VFLVTAGMFGEGDSFTFPLGAWEWLFQGVYRLRALDLDNNELLGSWTFGKSCEGRKEPFSIQEMEQLGDSVAGAVQSSEAMA
jgi:hypothetical protein